MKRIILSILSTIKNFFNRIADKEAERVIALYSNMFKAEPEKENK